MALSESNPGTNLSRWASRGKRPLSEISEYPQNVHTPDEVLAQQEAEKGPKTSSGDAVRRQLEMEEAARRA